MTKLLGIAAKPHPPAVDTMLIGEAAVHLYRPGGQDSRHAVEPHARTVTADGYLKSRVRACRGSHPNCRRRLEYTTLTRLHLDIPSMQRISVERCPMETMVMRGRTWLSMR